MRPPEFWSRKDAGARTIANALSPLGFLYGASVAWKHRWQKPWRARAGVVCVGNLTVGGTGKTPVAIALGKMLQARGIAIAFLTRGYGRRSVETILVDPQRHDAAMVGDEALMLARVAPTVVARDRRKGAELAEQQGAEIIVMDDGHQNFTLAKNLSLVVVDGETGFGNGGIVPAGPLRESVRQGLGRADALIVTGEGFPRLSDFVRPVFQARLSCDIRLDGRSLIAFAGIGRPEKFFATLRAQGAKLLEAHAFEDHHVYSDAEIAILRDRARLTGAELMTTEKDFVRLGAGHREGIGFLPVRTIFDDEDAVARLLAPVAERSPANP